MDPLREFGTMAVLATGKPSPPCCPRLPTMATPSNLRPSTRRGIDYSPAVPKTARRWDPFTGRQIALLRHADEKVIEAGLSPGWRHCLHPVLGWGGPIVEDQGRGISGGNRSRTGRIKSIDTKPPAPGKTSDFHLGPRLSYPTTVY